VLRVLIVLIVLSSVGSFSTVTLSSRRTCSTSTVGTFCTSSTFSTTPAPAGTGSGADDKVQPPRLPIATRWSAELTTGVATAPVADGERIFLALRSAHLAALDIRNGREVWRIQKDVSSPFTADAGLVFVSAGDAIEALRAADGASAWLVPRLKAVAPLLAAGGLLFVVSDAEIVAIRTQDGQVAWRHPAGGARHAPAIDGDRLYLGADDGRILAMETATGVVRWETYVSGGVTAIAAHRDRVYVGAGDKFLYCLDGRSGTVKWPVRVGAIVSGSIAVDDERVYFAALDNVVRALDRGNGNQRWKTSVSKRPIAGVRALGHVVFVPVAGAELVMLFDRNGAPSGTLTLPGETSRDAPPDVRETAAGLQVSVVTGGLSNLWHLTFIGPAGEAALEPFSSLTAMPGAMFLTDPVLAPLGRVLPWMVLSEPTLQPLRAAGWPIVLRDPPLEPLTALPGLQLRPLSPVLPSRREL
jgi:outer membrane protein assembly factor BamB